MKIVSVCPFSEVIVVSADWVMRISGLGQASGVKRRMLLFPESATKSIPLSLTVIPRGKLNWAVVASPSIEPDVPVPAIVETLPSVPIRRMLWLD